MKGRFRCEGKTALFSSSNFFSRGKLFGMKFVVGLAFYIGSQSIAIKVTRKQPLVFW
jgi:hypothetical protein